MTSVGKALDIGDIDKPAAAATETAALPATPAPEPAPLDAQPAVADVLKDAKAS